jgi:hypothetical protein
VRGKVAASISNVLTGCHFHFWQQTHARVEVTRIQKAKVDEVGKYLRRPLVFVNRKVYAEPFMYEIPLVLVKAF